MYSLDIYYIINGLYYWKLNVGIKEVPRGRFRFLPHEDEG
jgi:hypothetical protein